MNKLLTVSGAVCLVAGAILLTAGLAKVGETPARLTWRNPEVRPSLMTLGYKVYANNKVDFGRHYLAKVILQNEGDHPITDFSISYKIDDYVPWTEPETFHTIPAGFSFSRLVYPRLPPTVTALRNATRTNLHIRLKWSQEGRPREEVFTRDLLLRGVNELAYSDLPKSEMTGWHDFFNAAAFASAMVTPNDPVVQLYSGEITKAAGGTTAGIAGGRDEVVRICRTVYDYMIATKLRYTGAKGVPEEEGENTTMVQTVRLPRDVIVNNQGLCIELALLWSSLLEHIGVRSVLVFVPGHVFVVAYSPDQSMPASRGLPIECTAITPRAVDRQADVPFEDAVKMAGEALQRAQQSGKIILLPVQDLQAMGFTPPELPDVDLTRLADVLTKRLPQAAPAAVAQEAPRVAAVGPQLELPEAPQPPPPPAGARPWHHPQGYVSVNVPADFVTQPGGYSPFVLMTAGNVATGASCDVMQFSQAREPQQALAIVAATFAQMGLNLQVTGSRVQDNGVTMFTGMTHSAMGSVQWVSLAKVTPGGVILVSAGAPSQAWAAQSTTLQAVLGSVRFR